MERISYTNKGVIPSGLAYSNINPCYTITSEFEIPEGENRLEYLNKKMLEIKEYIDGKIYDDFLNLTQQYKQVGLEGQRFTEIDGVKYPHVTNIITPDKPNIPYIEDHARLGTALDTTFKNWIDEKEFLPIDFKDSGNIKQTYSALFAKAKEWVNEFGNNFLDIKHSVFCKNSEFVYVGELDAAGFYDGKKAIIDFKKTEKITKEIGEKYFKQMAAYAYCLNDRPEILVIASPYNKPIITDEVEKYFHLFLVDRGIYRERFGV